MKMPSLLFVAVLAAGASACAFGPRLTPQTAGCYRVELDSLPLSYRRHLVPALPEFVRLDTANGGELHVPQRWFEAQGINLRSAILLLTRPGWRLEQGRAVVEGPGWLPADSIALAFAGGGATLSALLAAESPDVWRGVALMWPNPSDEIVPPIALRLSRGGACGETPMAVGR
jgi:hypothetical protein